MSPLEIARDAVATRNWAMIRRLGEDAPFTDPVLVDYLARWLQGFSVRWNIAVFDGAGALDCFSSHTDARGTFLSILRMLELSDVRDVHCGMVGRTAGVIYQHLYPATCSKCGHPGGRAQGLTNGAELMETEFSLASVTVYDGPADGFISMWFANEALTYGVEIYSSEVWT